jgi:hypothetical protein
MLKDLVTRLGKEPKRGFYPLAEQAVMLARLPDPQEHVNALTVVSRLRNTLHNRGHYEGQTQQFNLEGVRYEFNDGEIMRGCASWDHVAHGIACALKSIRHMIDCVPA